MVSLVVEEMAHRYRRRFDTCNALVVGVGKRSLQKLVRDARNKLLDPMTPTIREFLFAGGNSLAVSIVAKAVFVHRRNSPTSPTAPTTCPRTLIGVASFAGMLPVEGAFNDRSTTQRPP
jgi:hypothetical protein